MTTNKKMVKAIDELAKALSESIAENLKQILNGNDTPAVERLQSTKSRYGHGTLLDKTYKAIQRFSVQMNLTAELLSEHTGIDQTRMNKLLARFHTDMVVVRVDKGIYRKIPNTVNPLSLKRAKAGAIVPVVLEVFSKQRVVTARFLKNMFRGKVRGGTIDNVIKILHTERYVIRPSRGTYRRTNKRWVSGSLTQNSMVQCP